MRKIHFLFLLCFCVFAQEVTGDDDDIKIGDDCELNEDCEDIPNAICDSSDTCECIEGYLASANNTKCLPLATKIGDKCEILQQCSAVPSSECLNNTCVLPRVLLPNVTTTQPTTAKPEEECSKDSDCSSFLFKHVCRNGTCIVGLPPVSPISIGLDVLGKPCSNDSECSGEGVGCIDKLCKCIENFVTSQNLKSCLPKAKSVGEKCTESSQCLALNGSLCENGKCTEKITRFLSNLGEKIPPLLIGSSCQTDNDCKHLTHALCLENVCQCKDKFITSVSSNACLEKAEKEGDPCEIDKQCENVKGAICLQKKCVKPGVVGTKLKKENSGSTAQTVSKGLLAGILLIKTVFL